VDRPEVDAELREEGAEDDAPAKMPTAIFDTTKVMSETMERT